jgi:hypothetical protein
LLPQQQQPFGNVHERRFISMAAQIPPGRMSGNKILDIHLLGVTVEFSGNGAFARLSSHYRPEGINSGGR